MLPEYALDDPDDDDDEDDDEESDDDDGDEDDDDDEEVETWQVANPKRVDRAVLDFGSGTA